MIHELFDIIIWWGLLELIGLITFPLVVYLIGNLSDKGYSVSKTLGLLLLTYITYVLSRHIGLPYDRTIIIISLLIVTCCSFALLSSKKVSSVLKSRNFWKNLIITDAVFAVSFILFLSLQMLDPDIDGGEAPMDFSYVNSVVRSSSLPPPYPWYSGKSLESCYYYFGHFIVATLTKLSGIQPSITYNLAMCTFMSILAVSSFGMGFNLTKKYVYGLLAIYFVVFMANIFGLMHFINTLFPKLNFYTPSYAPSTRGTLFQRLVEGGDTTVFWWSTRVIPWTITEVPWFTFLWSDLHAHLMSHSFVLLVITFVLSIFISKKTGFTIFGETTPEKLLKIVILSICIGFLFPQFIWVYPILLIFSISTFAVQQYSNSESFSFKTFLSIFSIGGIITILSFAFFSNIFIELLSASKGKFSPEINKTSVYHFLILFALSMFLIFIYLFYKFSKLSIFKNKKMRVFIYIIPIVFIFIVALTIIDFFNRPFAFFSPLKVNFNFNSIILNFQMLIICIPLILLSLIVILRRNSDKNEQFICLMILVGTLIVLFSELYSAPGRYVFIFKVYNPLWIFLELSSVYIVFYISKKLKDWKSKIKFIYLFILCFLVISSSIFYLVLATYAETNGFKPSYGRARLTLDGLDFLNITHREDYEAIKWINENIKGVPVILEAPGKQYTYTSQVASYTGLPTVLGWEFHASEVTQAKDIENRTEDVNNIYNTTDNDEALKLLKKYNVEYIYIGEIEHGPSIIFDNNYVVHGEYMKEGLEKFSKYPEFYSLVYNNSNVQIYHVKK